MTHDEYFPGSNARLHAWIVEQKEKPFCWVCGYDWSKFNAEMRRYQTHHIERKSHCYPEYANVECNFFACCEDCHAGPLATMSHAEQIAYKKEYDPENYHPVLWLHCRDGPVIKSYERVEEWEIDMAHMELFDDAP